MKPRSMTSTWFAVVLVLSLLAGAVTVVWAQTPAPGATAPMTSTAPVTGTMTNVLATFNAQQCYAPATPSTPKIKAPQMKKPPYRIALSNSYIGNVWRTEMIQMARAYQALPEIKSLISELYVVSSGNDASAQIAIVDSMIAAGYDAIIMDTASPDALNPAVARAHDAGILVVTFDNVSTSPYAVRINEDQVAFGRTMADWLAKQLNGKGNVFMITGVPGTTVDNGRNKGAQEVWAQNPGIKIIGQQPGMWADGPAQTVMATALGAFPTIDGVWCQGGDTGVVKAFLDAKRPLVPIAGEAENGFRKYAVQYKIPIISVGQTPAMVCVAEKLCTDMLQGMEVPQDINVPLPVVTSDQLKAGVNYFPDVTDNFFDDILLPLCGVQFTIDQVLAQSAF